MSRDRPRDRQSGATLRSCFRAGLVLLALGLSSCVESGRSAYQGYAEGEFVRVAAPFAGSLTKLAVARGGQVEAGDALFVLEQENEAAGRGLEAYLRTGGEEPPDAGGR